MMVVFGLHNGKKLLGFWGGAPNTHTSIPYRQAKKNSMRGMEVLEVHSAQKILFRFLSVAPNTHTSVPYRSAKVFLDT